MVARSRLLAIGITLLALYCTAYAGKWDFMDTPAHFSNSTAGPISYEADCGLCGYNCSTETPCCGGYITNSAGNSTYMCQSSCLAKDYVCCGCNDPADGQISDPNLLCVSCPSSSKCYYNPNSDTNVRYYCVSSAQTIGFSALFIISALLMAALAL